MTNRNSASIFTEYSIVAIEQTETPKIALGILIFGDRAKVLHDQTDLTSLPHFPSAPVILNAKPRRQAFVRQFKSNSDRCSTALKLNVRNKLRR